ncbi:MAG: HlyD family type I secretion periplasmic adaptor subunit [Burkholderiales bacterium]
MHGTRLQLFAELVARYARAFRAAWMARHEIAPGERTPLERQFLPAALEIMETPAPALPRAILWTMVAALALGLAWSFIGQVDVIAVASGKVIAADKAKLIQPAETAVVKRILVDDGQEVKAGQVLIELEAAATATAAETARARDSLYAARLEAARYDALARAASGTLAPSALRLPLSAAILGNASGKASAAERIPPALIADESRAMQSQYREHRAKLAGIDAEIFRRAAEIDSVRELVAKLAQTAPIARRRAEDYKNLVQRKFMSEHGYLEKEQIRIEQERDLSYQEARVKELAAGIEEARSRRQSLVAEFERTAVNAKVDADKKAAQIEQELIKAQTRENQQILVAPVDGTVQQLAVHTVGGVVTPAQALLVIAPRDYHAEVEGFLENKDVGFVKLGQRAEVKIETFPFTRYGTVPGSVIFVSNDAVNDEKRGPIFQVRVKLDRGTLRVEQRDVTLTPGMAVSAEIATAQRRVIEFFLDPIRKTVNEGLRER